MVGISDIVRFDKLEDRITAQLIATIENCPKDKVMTKFFSLFGFEPEPEDVAFSLQVQELESRPDAMIEGTSFLIYVETKLGDHLDAGQIESHYEGGRNKKPTFLVLCITAGLDEPREVQEAIATLRAGGMQADIRWLNWKRIYTLFRELADTLNNDKSIFLLRNFTNTLEMENLSGFTPFKKEEFLTAEETIPTFTDMIGKLNLLMDETSSILEKDSVKRVLFYRNGKASGKIDFITEAKYGFNKSNWAPSDQNSESGSQVIVQFFLNKPASLLLGFWITREVLYKPNANWKALIQELENPENAHYYIQLRIQGRTADVESNDFIRQLEETKEDRAIDSVFFFNICSLDTEGVENIDPSFISGWIKVHLETLQNFGLYELIETNT